MSDEALIGKIDITKDRIIRALLCASGQHEAWERQNSWNARSDVVYLEIQSRMHDKVHCAVCKHCRLIYVRRRDE